MKIVNFVFFEHPKYLLSVVGLTQILPSRNVNEDGEFFLNVKSTHRLSQVDSHWEPLEFLFSNSHLELYGRQ